MDYVEDCATTSPACNSSNEILFFLKKRGYNHSRNSLSKPAADLDTEYNGIKRQAGPSIEDI